MDRPLGGLWETIGWCGRPPKDQALLFATIAIVLTLVGGIALPLLVGALLTLR